MRALALAVLVALAMPAGAETISPQQCLDRLVLAHQKLLETAECISERLNGRQDKVQRQVRCYDACPIGSHDEAWCLLACGLETGKAEILIEDEAADCRTRALEKRQDALRP